MSRIWLQFIYKYAIILEELLIQTPTSETLKILYNS